ncbi:MAG: hypothetical protein V1667_00525 [bacterium]
MNEENKKKPELLKIKISAFLINYFNYFISFIGIAILTAGLLAFIVPKYKMISKENEDAKNRIQVEYAEKTNRLNSARNLKESYKSASDGDKSKISAMIPAGSDTSAIISEIESISLRNGAILNSVKIETKSASADKNLKVETEVKSNPPAGIFSNPPEKIGLIKIEASLSSVNYSVLKNIIKSFENSLRLFDIAGISYQAEESQAILNIYSYYLSQ